MAFSDQLMGSVKDIWENMMEHPFITDMIDGSLDKNKFTRYLIQDTIYLKYYAKVYAWGMIKSDDTEIMRRLYRDMDVIVSDESMMHIQYLKDLGYSEEEALAQPVHPVNKAYLDYMLHVSQYGTLEEGLIGLMPCALSYYYIASNCRERAIALGTYENNYYKEWIDHYCGEGYKGCYDRTVALCDLIVKNVVDTQKRRLLEVFLTGTEHEFRFWDMAFAG